MSTKQVKNAKPERKSPPNAIESSKIQKFETEFLEGQEHNIDDELNPNQSNELGLNQGKGDLNNDDKSNLLSKRTIASSDKSLMTEEEKIKNGINTKRRYLKEKMDKLKLGKNILQGVSKSIDKQMKRIEIDIKDEQILLTEIPKNINKFIQSRKDFQEINSNTQSQEYKTPLEIYEMKKEYKAIKELKEEKDILTQKLSKLLENEKLMNSEEYINMSLANKPDAALTKNLLMKEKKELNEKKTEILRKINLVDNKLDLFLSKNDSLSRKQRVQSFIENFEKDKEKIEERAKKYMKESEERKKRLQNDINQLAEKRKKELDDKDKEAELQKSEMIKKFREQEKAIVLKRTKENDQKADKFKPFLKEKFKGKIEDYLFAKNQSSYEKKENKIQEKENNRRKNFMKPIDSKEINKFGKNYLELREKALTDLSGKKKKLLKEWRGRREQLPVYVSPTYDLGEKELLSNIEKEEEKKKIQEGLKEKKNLYSQEIIEKKQPKVNEKLKKERIDIIRSLENPKEVLKENLLFQRRNKEILSAKQLKNSPRTNRVIIKVRTKPRDDSFLNNSQESINNKQSKGTGDHPLIKSVTQPRKPLDKKIDYLTQMIDQKRKKELERAEKYETTISGEGLNRKSASVVKSEKWLKFINDDKGNLVGNINYVKQKAENLDEAVKLNEEMLKLHGGIKNDPELGQKVSNMLIDSITAKLSILTKING